VRLELRLLADAALVGFPNAGKSTLISAVSASKPKIADYPFTTLVPNLGVVRFQDHEFVLADLPGLIEGAAENRGLGHQFLRHVERARVLVILCDLAPVDERSPAEQERILLDELGRYQPELLERPRLVVGSKADVATRDFDGLRISGAPASTSSSAGSARLSTRLGRPRARSSPTSCCARKSRVSRSCAKTTDRGG
jgi:GTP-binding protein